ncbi:hypothetical protein BJ944DRAFT_267876 [Cunninghamella echinulata]|nr:hypothetical protein BJ944DRAFT_267876 [Cunninghamella echinulata]
MNLITPYNQTQVSTGPSTTSIMENIATSNEPLQKSITKSPEINAGYSPILQRTNNSANTSTTTTIPPPSPTNSTIANSLVDAQYQQSGKQDQDQTQPQKRSKQKNDMNLAPPYQQQQPQQHHQQLPPQIMPRSSIPFPPPTSSYYNSNSYSLAYPPYPTNQQQQQQPPPMYIQPNTGNYGSHYFPPSQYNYGDESYMNPSGIPSNTPVSPPLQHQSHHQKLISPSTHSSSHHHHQHHPPTLLPYGVPPSQQHQQQQQQQQQQPVLSKLTEPNYQDIHQHPHPFAGIVSRPHLNIHGDLMAATMNWTTKEWDMRRRVLRFWRQQQPNSHQIDCGYEVLDEESYRSQRLQLQQETGGDVSTTGGNTASSFKDNLVVSCIYWQERNDFFITSVDCIQLIEGLIGVEFTVEEKNRIRRNLEALRPLTAAKTRPESVEFFKLIMSFPSPKPRNIEKDVKVFLWSTLGPAIKKIVGKYTPSYSSTASIVHYDHHQPQQQRNVSGHMSRG